MHEGMLKFAGVLVLGLSALVVAPNAHAAVASPSSISVDCGITNGVTSTQVTGRIGDTFTIQNTSGTTGCDFANIAQVVTVTNLDGSNVLASSTTATVTILGPGTFTVTPKVSGPTTGTMTVVIGDPNPLPEFEITFDANGGTCSSNPLTITAAAGDWYALPTDGTGSFQCHRPGYQLIGWLRNDTLVFGGSAEQVPDVHHGQQAAAADHTYLHALWRPIGMELTLDANVDAQHSCIVGPSTNLDPADRSVTSLVPEEQLSGYVLPTSAPCTPPGHTLKGWSLGGASGSESFRELPSDVSGLFTLTLFAQWEGPNCSASAGPGVNLYGCQRYMQNFANADLRGADLRNGAFYGSNFQGADLSGADLRGATIYGANFTNAKLDGVIASGAIMYVSRFNGADLSRGNFSGASLYGSCMETANLSGATFSGADMNGTVVPSGSRVSGASGRLIVGKPPRVSIFPFGDYYAYERACVTPPISSSDLGPSGDVGIPYAIGIPDFPPR